MADQTIPPAPQIEGRADGSVHVDGVMVDGKPAPRRVDELIPLAAQARLDEDAAKATSAALRAELFRAALWVQEQTGTKPTLRHEDATISLTVPEGGLAVRGDGQEYLGWRAQRHPDDVVGVYTHTLRFRACDLEPARAGLAESWGYTLPDDIEALDGTITTVLVLARPVDLNAEHEALVDDGRLVAVYDRATGEEVPGLKWNPPAAPYVSVRPTAAAKARAAEAGA